MPELKSRVFGPPKSMAATPPIMAANVLEHTLPMTVQRYFLQKSWPLALQSGVCVML
jgi:hypothetical protein